jgi:hypothetical protein
MTKYGLPARRGSGRRGARNASGTGNGATRTRRIAVSLEILLDLLGHKGRGDDHPAIELPDMPQPAGMPVRFSWPEVLRSNDRKKIVNKEGGNYIAPPERPTQMCRIVEVPHPLFSRNHIIR